MKVLSQFLRHKLYFWNHSRRFFPIQKNLYHTDDESTQSKKVYIETYGCQMNFSDSGVALSILQDAGYERVDSFKQANVILLMTCAIREGAELKIWNRLKHFRAFTGRTRSKDKVTIGVLGCMAERLKRQLLESEPCVDVVCGPDAYRDLPRLVGEAQAGHRGMNVALSLEETYAEVAPVRLTNTSDGGVPSAFVSVMRGCDNMCTYCIVPFTRGRERSRPLTSIVDEVYRLRDQEPYIPLVPGPKKLVTHAQGIREVVLLGQNVNSYRDISSEGASEDNKAATNIAEGFTTVYRTKIGGLRFVDLLEAVSSVDPEIRVRFTSPHPKDFPDDVLHLIQERRNICNQLHLPAQSGSSRVLERMGRGYSREAYLSLATKARAVIPGVALTSDFIAGFCGETEEDHRETLSLMAQVRYNFAFCFPYSMRAKQQCQSKALAAAEARTNKAAVNELEVQRRRLRDQMEAKTRAYHRLEDNIPDDVKMRRHLELIAEFRRGALDLNQAQVGQVQLTLAEGSSKRSSKELAGRNEANTKVIYPRVPLPWQPSQDAVGTSDLVEPTSGDYVAVKIVSATSQTLRGIPLYRTTLHDFKAEDYSYNNEVYEQKILDTVS